MNPARNRNRIGDPLRFSLLIISLALAALLSSPAFAEEPEFTLSITGFSLDLGDPDSVPEIATIHFDPERGFNDQMGLLSRNSIGYDPVLSYTIRTDQPLLIQARIKDLTNNREYASEEFVAMGSAGTRLIHGQVTLDKAPFNDYLWSFLVSVKLRSDEIASKVFHVYLVHPDFEPDVTEQNRYKTFTDPEPQTIWEGDYPPVNRGNMEIPAETTGFIMTDQNEARLEDMLINPILYELIKARPFRPVEGEVPPGSHYSYTVIIHWKPVVGTIFYRTGFIGSGDNAYRDILRQKKVCLYIADPETSVPDLRVEMPGGMN
jgi:hypothetical protein